METTLRARPAELPAPPRQLQRRYISVQVLVARFVLTPAIIITLAVVAVMAAVSIFGLRYQARITNIREKKLPNDSTAYFAQYSFDVNGKTFNAEQRLFDFDSTVAVGNSAIVRSADLLGYRYSTLADGWGDFINQYGTMLIGMSVLSMLGAWVILFRGWILPGRQKWLARQGVIAAGIVSALPPGPQFRCMYSFTDPSGMERKGTYRIPPARALRLSVGDPLTILYDASRPARHMVYEFCDFIILDAPKEAHR